MGIVSAARIEANRQNAAKSTGPRTAAGKARSRLNAFQHGLAGAGDLIGPGDDQRLIDQRAAAFIRDLGVSGETGQFLARRAAVLSVRLDRAAVTEQLGVAADVEEAQAEFDQIRLEELAEHRVAFEAGGDGVQAAIRALEGTPEGVTTLIGAWEQVIADLGAADPGLAQHAAERAALWLGWPAAAATAEADWTGPIHAALSHLARLAGSMAPQIEQIEQARTEAGILVRLHPSAALALARRYEATTERGMYRAFETIADLKLTRHQAPESPTAASAAQVGPPRPTPPAPPPITPVAPTPPRLLAPAPVPAKPPAVRPLGSFRAGVEPPAPDLDRAPVGTAVLDITAARPPQPAPRPSKKRRKM